MTFDPHALGSLGITEEQIELMDIAENLCRDSSNIATVRVQMDGEAGFDSNLWSKISALGWLGIAIPESYGGVGLSLAEVVPVAEQMGRRMMALPFVSTTLAAQALLSAGTEEQKQNYLPKISEGLIASLALSEINGSFDLNDIETQAAKTPAGYEVTGRKILVQNLDSAQLIILSAKLDGKLCLFAIDADVISKSDMRREILIDETKRSFELTLDRLNLPDSALLDLDQTKAALERIEAGQRRTDRGRAGLY